MGRKQLGSEAVGVRAHLVISAHPYDSLAHPMIAAAPIRCAGRFDGRSQADKSRTGAGRRTTKERAPGNCGQSTGTPGVRKARATDRPPLATGAAAAGEPRRAAAVQGSFVASRARAARLVIRADSAATRRGSLEDARRGRSDE